MKKGPRLRKSSTFGRKNKVSLEQRERMFQAFMDLGSARAVSQQLGIPVKTCRMYEERDRWWERRERIESSVREKTDNKIVNRRLRNVQILDTAIDRIAKDLSSEEVFVPVKMLPRLVLAQETLLGAGAADDEQAPMSIEAQQALNLLQSLPPEALTQLAGVLAERMNVSSTQGLITDAKKRTSFLDAPTEEE